jgi:hypothetical protein
VEPVSGEQRRVAGEPGGELRRDRDDDSPGGLRGGGLPGPRLVADAGHHGPERRGDPGHRGEVRRRDDEHLGAAGAQLAHRCTERGRGLGRRHLAGQVVRADDQQRQVRVDGGGPPELGGEVEGGGAGDRDHVQLDRGAGVGERAGQPGAEGVLRAGGTGAEGERVTEDEEAEHHTVDNTRRPFPVP